MLIVGIVVFVLLVVGIPIGIALSASSAVYILIDPLLAPEVIFRAFFNFISRYSLMAIPLFIYAGYLMERTGLIAQLFKFADALVGSPHPRDPGRAGESHQGDDPHAEGAQLVR